MASPKMPVWSRFLLLLLPAAAAQLLVQDWRGGAYEAPKLEAPANLSEACSATFNQRISCHAALLDITMGRLVPTETQLDFICRPQCAAELERLVVMQNSACTGPSDALVIDGKVYPPTTFTLELQFTYNYTCLKDSSEAYCLPKFDDYNSRENATSAELCSECNLRELQYQLSSPFGWDDDLAASLSSLTQSCGATTGYAVALPAPLTLNSSVPATATPNPTTTSVAPSNTCVSTYTVQAGDDCHSISKAQGVSTFDLMVSNNLAGYCSNFPGSGAQLCMPHRCQIYTVQADDSCWGIVSRYNNAFTVTQLRSWNRNINEACTNLNMIRGYEICVSFPGDAQITPSPTAPGSGGPGTQVPAPTNVAPDTNPKCSRYYTVKADDTCAVVAQLNGISLDDFYLLNPSVDQAKCSNLWLGSAYCVRPVGDIRDYPEYYIKLSLNPCLAMDRPPSCYTTYPEAPYWEWPTATVSDTATAPVTTSTALPPRPTLTEDLPLAPGSRADCASYTHNRNLTSRHGLNTNTCTFAAYLVGVDVADFLSWNPSLARNYDVKNATACTLQFGLRYCASARTKTPNISGSSSSISSSSTPGTASRTTTTRTNSDGIATPTAIQPGMVPNCNKFYFVQPGDGCWAIANSQGIDLGDFYAWNPAVQTSCAGLQASVYVCVGVASASTIPAPVTKTTTTTKMATTTTTTTKGAPAGATPSPVQNGMVSGCNKFYLVKGGDGCWDIATAQGISLSTLYSWNPALNGDCSGLWPNYYICVGRS